MAIDPSARMPLRVRVKICGNRSFRDVCISVTTGADALGFICGVTHLSEDALEPAEARSLSSATQAFPYISRVLVTHLSDAGEILRLAEFVGVDTIQLHGEIDPSVTERVRHQAAGVRVVQAVHVVDETAIDWAENFAPYSDAILLDSRTADRLGGTGRTHDWAVSRRIVERMRQRDTATILAGGLNPRNVVDAVQSVRPDAVDVNSGVDDERGEKSLQLASEFVAALATARRVRKF